MEADPMDFEDGVDDLELQQAIFFSMQANVEGPNPVPQVPFTAADLSAMISQINQPVAPEQPVQTEQGLVNPSGSLFQSSSVEVSITGGPSDMWFDHLDMRSDEPPRPSNVGPFPEPIQELLTVELSQALGLDVVLVTNANSIRSRLDRPSCFLRLQTVGEAAQTVSLSSLDMAIETRLRPPHASFGQSSMEILSQCYVHAIARAANVGNEQVKAVLDALAWRLAVKGIFLLVEDEDGDLYLDSGSGLETESLLQAVGVGHISSSFLEGMADLISSQKKAQEAWGRVLKQALLKVGNLPFTQPQEVWQQHLYVLDVLTAIPKLQYCLAVNMIEATKKFVATGVDRNEPMSTKIKRFEQDSWMASLVSVSTLPDFNQALLRGRTDSKARDCFVQHRGYPGLAGSSQTVQQGLRLNLQLVQGAAHAICDRLVRAKGVGPAGLMREAVVGWLSAAAASVAVVSFPKQRHCSDGFAIGVLALALKFCGPIVKSPEKFLSRFAPSQHMASLFRFPDLLRATKLAGPACTPEDSSSQRSTFLAPQLEGAHFVTDTFFITQQLFADGLTPTVERYYKALEGMMRNEACSKSKEQPLDVYLLSDCTFAQMMDPEFVANAVSFVMLEAVWLRDLMGRPHQEARSAFSVIPEYVVKDMASWLCFVIRSGHADQVAGVPGLSTLMDCLTGLLQRSDLVRSALVHSKIVELLLAMLAPHLDSRRSRGALGPSLMGTGERALLAAVLGSGATQEDLVPALMRVYAAADIVVGLDVDVDQFDKFNFRHQIDNLLMAIWQDPGCFESTTRMAERARAGGGSELFSDYVGAVLNSLMYLLPDSLDRLQTIHELEQSQKDEQAWQSLHASEKKAKEEFAASQGRVAKGFMRMAVTSLQVLNRLSSDTTIKQAFLQPPLSGRAAYASTTLINTLVGPRGAGLQVESPEKYNFHPERLLQSMLEFMLRLAEAPSFTAEMAAEFEYDEGIMRVAHARLLSQMSCEYGMAQRLESLISQVAQMKATSSEARPMEIGALHPTAAGLPYEEASDLAGEYRSQLASFQFGSFDGNRPDAYSSAFQKLAAQTVYGATKKTKRVNKELRQFLKGETPLPLSVDASIFVRFQEDRPDKMRVLVTGPEGTPYFGGCFFFDVFFPDEYPNVPPLMSLETTGGGKVRFNANLYNDGKVCLSLLGTWHASHPSEKWDQDTANLWRILVSIQGMILIPDPYFNEPGFEDFKGMEEGTKHSRKWNLDLALKTLRFAINEKLSKPPPGFEEVVRRHFRLLAHRILANCARCLDEAGTAGMDKPYMDGLNREIALLHYNLSQL
eukprot:jgi/Botrbrau1/331/Bobra.0022s0288.1